MKPRRAAFHKLRILKYAEETGSVVKACRYFEVGRASFYRWKVAYEKSG
ncbi:helix-turn-helix domain-containing protein [Martelella mediterranea]